MADKRRRRVILGLLLAVVLGSVAVGVAVVVLRKTAPRAAQPIGARLELAAGEVTVEQAGQTLAAVSGTALYAEAKVTTGAGARALVRLPDGSRLFLRAESTIELSPTEVKLGAGEYWLDAPPVERESLVHKIGEISVGAVDAGLSLKRVDDGAVVYVARGMAIVTAPGGRVEVNAGEQAKVKGSEAPGVEAVAFWEDWTGGLADLSVATGALGAGAGAIYGVDVGAPPGSPAQRLELKSQSVRAVVRDGLSETEVDQVFFNPGERAVEGWYWFTVPARASVTGFALETDGQLVEGEFIERREAAAQYAAAKATGHAPAILEWVDARSYRARIFPIAAGGTRRVVLRYLELSEVSDGKLRYLYPMGGGEPVRIGEFTLRVDLGAEGPKLALSTLAEARIEEGGKLVTMRRSGYTPRAPFQLEATLPAERPPLTVARFANEGQGADYVMVRYQPDVAWTSAARPRGDVVVVVDTSAGGDEAARQLKTTTAEAILRALSAEDRFALVSLDVKPTVLHPAEGLAPAEDQEIAKALEKLAEHASGGATDLASCFEVALGRVHGAEQPAVVYVGDGVATSGERTGEQLVERLRRALSTSRARLFTVAVGTEADTALLGELARAGGGQSWRVDQASDATTEALELAAALKVPTITDFEIDLGAGLDEPFVSTSGKVSQGAEVVVLARTHHQIPEQVQVKGRLGGKPFEKSYEVAQDKSVMAAFVPRLWASEYVRRLLGAAAGPDEERGRIAALGIEYGLMTPYTSILALESEAAYRHMGIERRKSRLRGVRLSALDPQSEQRLVGWLAAGAPPQVAWGCQDSPTGAEPAPPPPEQAAEGKKVSAGEPAPQPVMAQPSVETQGSPGSPRPADALAGPADKPENGKADDVEEAADEDRGVAAAPVAGHGTERGFLAGGGGQTGPGRLGELKTATPEASFERGRDLPILQPATCSDVSKRPLSHRVVLWKKRLGTAQSAPELVARYETAARACELPDWQAEQTFLKLLQDRIDSEGGAVLVLNYFRNRPDVQKYVAKLILRREVDPRIVAAVEKVLFGGTVDWNKVDLELSELKEVAQRIAKLREYVARAPEDPNGDIRMVKLLAESGNAAEALAQGRRLRDRGLMTLRIAQQLGDVLTRAGQQEEAVRIYSEIVEFDPQRIGSRQLLGDIYLARGWYEPAYRQYKTTTEAAPNDALGWLRLAAAAAGAGRVDEALRLEKQVATAQGRPGPADPRRFARLWSAARLGRLWAEPPKGQAVSKAAVERKLKELGLFRGPGVLVLLTWEDLASDLVLVSTVGDEEAAPGELTDGASVGLSASLLSAADYATINLVARLRSLPRDEPLKLVRHDIIWDGKAFQVKLRRVELAARETSISL